MFLSGITLMLLLLDKDRMKKENYRLISIMKRNAKNPKQNISNYTPGKIKEKEIREFKKSKFAPIVKKKESNKGDQFINYINV